MSVGKKTNCLDVVSNQTVEDAFGIPNATAVECGVLPLSNGGAVVLYYGASISLADFAGVKNGVLVDIKAGKVYTKFTGGSWQGIEYTAA